MLMIPPALATKSGAHRMSARREQVGHRLVGQLVVGRAGDDRQRSRGHRLVGRGRRPARTARARRPRRSSARSGRAQRAPSASASRRLRPVDVGHDQPSAPARAQQLGQPRSPTCPSPTTATLRPSQRRWCRTPARSRPGSPTSTPSAVNGLGSPEPPRRASSPATCGVPLGDHGHVAARRADVLGGDVAAAAATRRCRRSRAARPCAARRAARPAGGQHDHALAAAERQAGHGRLERHRAREPQRVAQGRRASS